MKILWSMSMLTVKSYISVRECFTPHIYISDEKFFVFCVVLFFLLESKCLVTYFFFLLSVSTTKVILRFCLNDTDANIDL
jgi:hypothetical protein